MSRIVTYGTKAEREYPDNVMTLNTSGDGVTTQNFAMETDTVKHTTYPRNLAEYMNTSYLSPAHNATRGNN